jgi:tRNA modification GTPase
MNYGGDRDSATICAVSTPAGFGGISVIRLSGQNTLKIFRCVFKNLPLNPESHKAYFGQLLEPAGGSAIDQVVATYFAKDRSFSGDETIEISCHGNPLICDQIMKALVDSGASTAMPGEFTYRAFMNQKLDLIQAESVLSLIESRSHKSANLAYRQLMGGLSEKIEAIENQMTWCLAHIEASIDFSTEGLETTSQSELIKKLSQSKSEIDEILRTYQKGRLVRDGIQIALLGQPNVGKSSLLNLLLDYDRSIVSNVAGTTRDVVSDETIFEGQRLIFLDTAGIRTHSSDEIENMGIKRSFEESKRADQIFYIFDLSQGLTEEDQKWLLSLDSKKVTLVGNKKDLVSPAKLDETLKYIHSKAAAHQVQVIFTSTVDKNSREGLLKHAVSQLVSERSSDNEVLLANSRHYECLKEASALIKQSVQSLIDGTGAEFVSLELKEALMRLQDMLGKRYDDQVMDRVFKEFCVGK